MAALDFPDNPTNGTVYDKWTYDGTKWMLTAGGGGGGGSGFTFAQEARPTATKVGDTWFDTSTLASGGTSWLAVEEAPGGQKVWVQFAPGSSASPGFGATYVVATANVAATNATPVVIPVTQSFASTGVADQWIVSLTVDIDLAPGAGILIATVSFLLDGVAQAGQVVFQAAVALRHTTSRNWLVTNQSAGSHTLSWNLALVAGTGSTTVTTPHTNSIVQRVK